MNNNTIVLPSARAIRHEQNKIQSPTLFLPNFITMSEFISKLCIVEEFKIVDDDSRVLLLLEASNFDSFKNLQIERNFFTFTKNSSYIFKFFEELSAEMFNIEALETSDIYGEYEEHIEILQQLYINYEKLCLEKKILDKIFLPKLYIYNESYASSHATISLHVDGHLTNFEIELLQKCCEFTTLHVEIKTSKFNSKMISKFEELGFDLEIGYEYSLDFNTKDILSKTEIETNKNISCESFSEPLLQVAYIQKKVYDFMQKGYSADNIAVILPDEKFAPLLKTFDTKANFNFAMGESYRATKIYEKLDATCKLIDQVSQENLARLERVGDEIYKELFGIYYKKVAEVDIVSYLDAFLDFSDGSTIEKKIYKEQVYSLKNIIPTMNDMSVKSIISLFLQRLGSVSVDDVRGGKVTVMGVLETRSVEFDAVVIVDFSDKFVPRRSDKDMFLNTNIREMAELPTMSDRENLQKHYYEMLINSTKEVAISFVASEQSSESRFLKYLGIKANNEFEESQYANVLFDQKLGCGTFSNANQWHSPLRVPPKVIVLPYTFKNIKLSATKLKTFLTCKRKYYYNYVQEIKGHSIPKDMPQEWEIGTAVHNALQALYSKKSSYSDETQLLSDLHVELDIECKNNELDRYLIEMQKRNLKTFARNEVKRFRDGWSVKYCERNIECNFEGMTLRGAIDRVDVKDNELYVLDYKTGKYPIYSAKNFSEATDFQLEFYHIFAQTLGKVSGCAYYDLKDSKIVPEAFLEEKMELLRLHVKELLGIEEVNFEMCEDVKHCQYCDYKIMCDRE